MFYKESMTAIAECYLMSPENNSNINNILKSNSGQKKYYVLYISSGEQRFAL